MPNRRGTPIEPSELEQANPFPAGRFAEPEAQDTRGAPGSRGRGSVPTRAVAGRPDSSTRGPSTWSGVNPLPPIDPSMPLLKPGDQGARRLLVEQGSVLVAGVGNIFLGDDGFGSEVARRLATRPLPAGTSVVDYGIGGIHLAYDLLAGVDRLVLVDALARGETPGTVSLLAIDSDEDLPAGTVDSHAMDPATVFASLRGLGGTVPPTVIVGCEPATTEEGIGLSPAVAAAVDPTIEQILALLDDHTTEPAATGADGS